MSQEKVSGVDLVIFIANVLHHELSEARERREAVCSSGRLGHRVGGIPKVVRQFGPIDGENLIGPALKVNGRVGDGFGDRCVSDRRCFRGLVDDDEQGHEQGGHGYGDDITERHQQ